MATFKHHLARRIDDTGLVRLLGRFVRRPGLLVLNYHRVGTAADCPFDEDLFSVTAEGFGANVRYLRDHFDLPSLDELVGVAEGGFAIRRPTALITFDDGYRDNFERAFPVLRALGVRAAFFVPTDYINRPRLAWWDRIAHVIKATRRETVTLEYPQGLSIDLVQTPRAQAIRSVIRLFKRAGEVDEESFFDHLEDRAEVDVDPEALGRGLFMSWDEIGQLHRAGMTIGSHTHTHRILARLPEADQRDELARSKEILEGALGRRVETIAYPVGERFAFSPLTERLAHEVGYRLGFSFYGGINRAVHFNPLDIRRIGVERHYTFPQFRSRVILYNLIGKSF